MANEEAERAIDLAQTIARDAIARIEEEFEGTASQNAATVAVLGYLTGIGDKAMAASRGSTPLTLLYAHARVMGEIMGAAKCSITEMARKPS